MEVEKKMKYMLSKTAYGNKDRQRKGRRYLRTNESRKHSKNQEIQILRDTINEEGNLKAHCRIKRSFVCYSTDICYRSMAMHKKGRNEKNRENAKGFKKKI